MPILSTFLMKVGVILNRHKSKGVRNTASKFCAKLVDKMGPGKALSGVKDTTDRLLEAVSYLRNAKNITEITKSVL